LGVVDEVVPEPAGGAHRDHDQAARLLDEALCWHVREISALDGEELLARRHARYRKIPGPSTRPLLPHR
jgi:acetyl-CoA carboxylase carboxyl transferase subunit alpha